ncbi:MAG: imidazoleglycerol-phosphate dehydratase HisB [Verrucomicrobia bacterium]|nr:imidazoleglycerol-phosphate dehydratase HisB [Verrucomicrobiota bacterium]
MNTVRRASQNRDTSETSVKVDLVIEGSGACSIQTGIAFFDHMLTLFSRHSLFDLQIEAHGDTDVDFHHTVEDTGIVLGACLAKALGDKTGIRRYGWALLPMDETLVRVAADLSGRAYLHYEAPVQMGLIGAFPFELLEEFLRAFTTNSALNLHVEVLHGRNSHHIAEAIFKALARTLDQACQIDHRVVGIPSSKGMIV